MRWSDSLLARAGGWVLSAGLALSACGGAIDQRREPGAAGAGAESGAMSAGGAAGNPIPGLNLDDDWFYESESTTGASELLTPETDASGDNVLHVVVTQEPARATVSTHGHWDVLEYGDRIEFSAKATDLIELRVSAMRVLPAARYFEALATGQPWPTAVVQVGKDWQRFSVPLSEMQPPETREPQGMSGFMFAFIIDHPRAIELWLDDVQFE